MTIDKEYLNSLTIVDYLENRLNELNNIYHIKKNDLAYRNANDFLRELNHRLVLEFHLGWDEYKSDKRTKALSHSAKVLDKYSSSDSEKNKEYFIDEFKREFRHDLLDLIIILNKRTDSTF